MNIDDLITRLLAAIDEDEKAARLAQRFHPTPWQLDPEVETTMETGRWVADAKSDGVLVANGDWAARYIARHDPARVLCRCAADRKMIERLKHILDLDAQGYYDDRTLPGELARETLANMAEGYGIQP